MREIGGYIFAPTHDGAGRTNQYWDNLLLVKPGATLLHYAGGFVRAVGAATDQARPASRPRCPDETEAERGVAGYRSSGRIVGVTYFELKTPLKLTDIPAELRTSRTGPFRDSGSRAGTPEQRYIDVITDAFLKAVRDLLGKEWPAEDR